MPIINVKISGPEDLPLAQSMADSITKITREQLNKKPEVTAVTITFVPDTLWFIGGRALKSWSQRSFFLNIKITDSTNIKTQKGAYIRFIYQSMALLLNGVNPASYIHIEEVKADAYGYDGVTMEHRFSND